ncbi:MAG: hypothetical protein J6T74_03520, partial [Clostridia bacterium]|nr:hypothetical protein [Clostridia bacterium]
ETPKLLITDKQLPKIDGMELCNIIKSGSSKNDIPIILISTEDKIFDLSSSGLVDEIYRSFGELWGCYRIGLAEANQRIGQMLWGIRLGILKCKKTADIFALLNVIKENHIGANLSIKEQEKFRARIINKFVIENITKGEVDV